MSKRGPLSKAEKFYIESHVTEMDVKEIAKDLDRTENTVSNHIEKAVPDANQENENQRKAGDFMARNETYGVTAMTEEASAVADEDKQAVAPKSRTTTAIHRIKNLEG